MKKYQGFLLTATLVSPKQLIPFLGWGSCWDPLASRMWEALDALPKSWGLKIEWFKLMDIFNSNGGINARTETSNSVFNAWQDSREAHKSLILFFLFSWIASIYINVKCFFGLSGYYLFMVVVIFVLCWCFMILGMLCMVLYALVGRLDWCSSQVYDTPLIPDYLTIL